MEKVCIITDYKLNDVNISEVKLLGLTFLERALYIAFQLDTNVIEIVTDNKLLNYDNYVILFWERVWWNINDSDATDKYFWRK